jgi:tetratricopeptide (TPR) repeat protein
MHRWLLILCALCVAPCVCAEPYLPRDDATVLERLPEKTDPSLKSLKRLRAAVAANPGRLELALPFARRAIEASRATGDPRFLGMAEAALAPWWTAPDAPAPALLMRAIIKQSRHDFAGALGDLDRLIAARPNDAQALLTRATVLGVQGRYGEARRDCAALAPRTTALVAAACGAGATRDADDAYRSLVDAPVAALDDAGVRAWASTLAGELAARRGDADAAERHFRAALALDPRDAYLKGAFADFLLDRARPREALPLVEDETRNDALLLRLALAERVLPDRAESYRMHRDELAARFDAARRLGDTVHRREEARFRLVIEGDAQGAVALARDNWAVQREPADLRILVEAARAAQDRSALAMANAWQERR